MQSKEPFYTYVDNVLSGKEVVGGLIRLAVERFVKDCDAKEYIFDYKEGKRIIDFAKLCNHWKGPKANTPIILDPHQHFYLIQKYGWKERDTGLPRFSRTYKEIARKTGKTTEAAIEGIFHMMKGIDHAAQIWTCATKEDDAIVLINDAGRIIEATPKLKPKFKLQISGLYVRRVSYPERQAFMAFMTKGQDAVDTSMGIGDECHDWPDASVKQRIESSMGNRIAPSFTNITTAGFDKSTYCYTSLRDKSIKILKGAVKDDRHLAILFELDESDDWKDKSKWIKANPNIPFSQTQMRYLEGQFTDAINEGGSTEVNFKTKNLNLWTDSASVWIQDELWMNGQNKIEKDALKGKTCYGGVYTASTESLNALVLYFPKFQDSLGVFLVWTWIPEKYVSENTENVDYRRWISEGYVTKTPGNSADHKWMAGDILAILPQYDVRVVGFDRTFGQYVAPDLEANGYQVMEVYQGFNNLAQQTEDLKKMVKKGEIEHFGNPLFRLHMMNTVLHTNQEGEGKPDKSASGSRIGIVSAALNAMVARFIHVKEYGEMDLNFTSLK